MEIGYQIMAWRRALGITQKELGRRAYLSRPYLSRLERGAADPTLSSLRRLAMALDIPIGRLLEDHPPTQKLTRQELDGLARAALRPGSSGSHSLSMARALGRFFHARRRALGLFTKRKLEPIPRGRGEGKHAARWLRATLGEDQWKALLRRIDKLASFHARPS